MLAAGTFSGLVVSMLACGTFGVLVVSMLASGSNPAEGVGFFWEKKSSAFLPSEGK
jgi:hypothetical protein